MASAKGLLRWHTLLVAAVILSHSSVHGLSWRLFAGREECVQEYMPATQWDLAVSHEADTANINSIIDLGVLITSRYGTEAHRSAVDLRLYDPSGNVIHSEDGLTQAEVSTTSAGGRGPWRACFKVSRAKILRPSVVVKILYFTVNHMSLLGTAFEWQRGPPPSPGAAATPSTVDVASLGSVEQVEALAQGLQRLDHYLLNVTHEQRYLSARTDRHLLTVESTYRRTFWYYLLLYSVIVLAAFAQVVGVRMMFKGNRGMRLII